MEKTDLLKLQKILAKLKEYLNCPICLECITDLVELECSHKYCRDCYTKFRAATNVGHCPVCKYEIDRRSIIYTDELVNHLGRFVHLTEDSLAGKNDLIFQLNRMEKQREFKSPYKKSEKYEPQIDVFDKVMRSSLKSHTRNSRQTDSSKRSTKVNEPVYKILDFDDDKNKDVVLRWLSDTKNKFDRLTQTQDVFPNGYDNPLSPEIISVSQAFRNRNKELNYPNICRARAKSLDIEIKKVDKKKKRHTDGCTDIIDNYDTEESTEEEEVVKRAEENVILNLFEDEVLNKLENEIQNKDSTNLNNCKNGHKSINVSQNSSTGWNRITQTKKTMKINDKRHKQLHIVLQSSENKSKRDTGINPEELPADRDPVNKAIPKSSTNLEHAKEKCSKENEKQEGKCYDLNLLEKYFEANLEDSNKMKSEYIDSTNLATKHDGTTSIQEQIQGHNESTVNKLSVADNKLHCDEEDVYLLPTQLLSNEIVNERSLHFEAIRELESPTKISESSRLKLLNIMNGFFNKPPKTDRIILKKEDLESVKLCIKKLKELQLQNISNARDNVKIDKITQTDKPFQCDMGIQTVKVLKNVAIQSAVTYENHFMQTEDFVCDKCSILKMNVRSSEENRQKVNINDTVCFTGSLDDFNFKTQEIAKDIPCNIPKKCQESPEKSSPQAPRNEQKPASLELSLRRVDDIPNSLLVCSIGSEKPKKINKKMSSVLGESGPKRYRNVLDSDSDEEIRPVRKRNRFLRNDLSIEFETEANTESNKKVPSSAGNESIDYDNYLAEVMKKYDDGELFEDKTAEEEVHMKQNIEVSCDQINMQVYSNIENLAAKKNKKRSSSDESYRTASSGNLESCDVIGKTETPVTIPKRMKSGNEKKSIPVSENKETKKIISAEICDEFNDDFDDVIVENLNEAETSGIKILENVIIQRKQNEMEEDVLFSDDDVVETTPQKLKSYRKLNESIISNIKQMNYEDMFDDDMEFDLEVLPPPPDFQDPVEQIADLKELSSVTNQDITALEGQLSQNNQKENMESSPKTLNTNDLSLTPDFSQYITIRKKEDTSLRDQVKTPKRNCKTALEHSTPLTVRNMDRETLGFSPITGTGNITNVQISSHTLLTNTPKQNGNLSILTSNPKQKSIWNYIKTSQAEKENAPAIKTKPCIACTRLSKDQIMSISQMTNKKLATYSATFDSSVTHMIVSVDEHNCIKDYTIKSVAAIAAGIWVLRFQWIQDCLTTNSVVREEPYEVLDSSGLPGPRTSRLTGRDNPLFKGYKFHCASPFYTTTQNDIQDIIKMLGGKVVSRLAKICENDGRIGLIIAEVKASQDLEVYEHYLDEYRVPTVDIEWLSKSVGRYQLISIRPYVWCSDDRLDELNYPAFLVEQISSASENM